MTLLDLENPIKEIRAILLPSTEEKQYRFCSIGYLPNEGIKINPKIVTWYDGEKKSEANI